MHSQLTALLAFLTFSTWAQVPCSDELSTPDLPPWESPDPNHPWLVEAWENNQLTQAHVYLKRHCNAQGDSLNKPFVFVEGIDFQQEWSAMQCGDFGWPQFVSGNDSNYPFLYNSPELIQALRGDGHDILLVDFRDGATYIQHNAAVVRKLLHLVKEWTANKSPVILAGASMGGQVTRYALRTMEVAGQNHGVRLWISLDSPHSRAHIPPSLQYMLAFLANPDLPDNANAMSSLAETLARPAARQMLGIQLPQFESLADAYYTELEALGFPEKTRTIGLANGNMHGQPNELDTDVPIVEYDFGSGLLGVNWAEFKANPMGGGSLLFYGKLPDTYALNTDWCINIPVSFTSEAFGQLGGIPLDHAPGGTRRTARDLVDQVNAEIGASDCGTPLIEEVQEEHCFIPTHSALGMPSAFLFGDLADALAESPELCPFDYYHGPELGNLQHSEISDEMLALILSEVRRGDNHIGPVLDVFQPNGGLYNLKDSAQYIVYDLAVSGGGQLRMNAEQAAYFGDVPLGSPGLAPPGSNLELRSNPCGADVLVSDSGILTMGDAQTNNSVTWSMGANSRLRVQTGGQLRLFEHSRLVVESGAELVIDGGTVVLEGAASIAVEPGGRLIFHSGEVVLRSSESAILMHGCFELGAGAHFQPVYSQTGTGVLHWFPTADPILAGNDSQFVLEGWDPNQELLHLHAGACLAFPANMDRVKCTKGRLVLEQESSISLEPHCHFTDISFDAPEAGAEVIGYRKPRFHRCTLANVRLAAYLAESLLRMDECSLFGPAASVFVKDGGLDITDCTFDQTKGIASLDRSEDSQILRCTFDGDGIPGLAAAVFDDSDASLVVGGCRFASCNTALDKSRGILTVRCCVFEDNGTAIFAGYNCRLRMNLDGAGGHNRFHTNFRAIGAQSAQAISLHNGRNAFHQEGHATLFEGTILGNCNGTCSTTLDATGNRWHTDPEDIPEDGTLWDLSSTNPDQDKVLLRLMDGFSPCPVQSGEQAGCALEIFDASPNNPAVCIGSEPKAGFSKVGYDRPKAFIFPNPARSQAVVWNTLDTPLEIRCIQDVMGNLVSTGGEVIEPGKRATLPVLQHGTYLITLCAAGDCWNERFVVLE